MTRASILRACAAVVVVATATATAIAAAAAPQRDPVLLTAFDEVWQTVNDTFYDPAFGGVSWDAVRAELRPRMEHAATDAEGRAVIRDMLARLGQSHFVLIAPSDAGDEPRGDATVPIDVRPSGDAMLVTAVRAGAPAGLGPGDQVLTVDEVDVAALFRAAPTSSPRARDLWVWRRVSSALSGGADTRAHLTWRTPDGGRRDADAARSVESGALVTLGNLPAMRVRFDSREARTASGRRVGVIGFNLWMAAVAQPFDEAIDRFRRADGLVIDLRGNPGGLADMIRGIAGHLLAQPAVLGRMRTRTAELEFRANPRRSTADGRAVEPYAGPVAILVDGLTGSASECFTGGLQSLGRVRVFGTPTMGQALPASTKTLSNGDVLMYAIGDFVTSTGSRLEGRGVVPDEIVPLDPAGLAAGHDALAAALGWLDRGGPGR